MKIRAKRRFVLSPGLNLGLGEAPLVVRVDDAIQTLKRVKKIADPNTLLVVRNRNGEIELQTSSGDKIVQGADKHLVKLRKKSSVQQHKRANYLLDESAETTASIQAGLDEALERNKSFYTSLALNIKSR